MKKLLLVLTVILVLLMSACHSSEDYVDEELLQRITDLENQVAEIETTQEDLVEILTHLGVITGLNGQKEYYIQPSTTMMTMSLTSLGDEKDYMDKTKLPSYLFDINGDFVDQHELGQMLKLKYFGESPKALDSYFVGFQYKMVMEINEDMSDEEFMARSILLFDELRNYHFYILGSSEIYLMVLFNGDWVEIKMLVQTLLNEYIVINPETVYNEWFFTTVTGIGYTAEGTQTYIDYYELNGDFDNYVLDYK